MLFRIVFVLLYVICATECSRILAVFPMPAPSHYILGNALVRGLVEAGHDVTMVSPYKQKNIPKGGMYTDIILDGLEGQMHQDENVNFIDMERMNPVITLSLMNYIGNTFTKSVLEHPTFQELLKSKQHFDVVIIEQFVNDALKALAPHFNAPLILSSTLGASTWVNPKFGNPSPPSYIPELMLSYTSNMTFTQRLLNFVLRILTYLNDEYIFYPAQNKLIKEYFPNPPDLSELLYNASIVLMNSHESTNQAVPHVPNMIEIGGYHLSPPKELPKDIKEFMDNATEGVVYFSMGSNIKPSQIPKETISAIIEALGKIKQKVLWKWNEDSLPGKPDNVKLGKWFPQQDILAHPNTKLFITHGGLLSATETVYHGVPILAFPVFGDQKLNAARAVMNGFGLSLYLSEITEERLSDALNKLLNDSKYRDNVKWRSQIMHDRPVKPLDLAVYWTEYVIRHRGAPHLRVAGVDLPWYQYLLLDVILFLALTSIISVTVLVVVIKKLWTIGKNRQRKVKLN